MRRSIQLPTVITQAYPNVARNLYQDPFIVPGDGATEMEIAHHLELKGVIHWPYEAVTIECSLQLWSKHNPNHHCS